MCGICGVIGESKDSAASFELLTNLFANTEQRGEDAAGYWGTQKGTKGAIAYHKEPGKSTDFIKRKAWRKIAKFDPNLILLHCRAATPGAGLPAINKNNHPFISPNGTIGLIHNGKVPDPEYKALAQRYELKSKCDSEILLRIFEYGKSRDEKSLEEDFPDWKPEFSIKLAAVRDIWSYMTYGMMAVAIGEWLDNGDRRLWMFRNKHRSLWLADLRHTLGQVFFFSTPKIWHDAICDCHTIDSYLHNLKVIEVPSEEIWVMQINEKNPTLTDNNLLKFKVATSDKLVSWKLNGESFKIPESKPPVELVTKLDCEDNVIDLETPVQRYPGFNPAPAPNVGVNSYRPPWPTPITKTTKNSDGSMTHIPGKIIELDDDFDDDDNTDLFHDTSDTKAAVGKLEDACKSLSQLVDDIETNGSLKLMESSLTPDDFTELMAQLDQIGLDLRGTLQIIGVR